MAAGLAVAEAWPGASQAICAVIRDPDGRGRCEDIQARPHLRTAAANATPSVAPTTSSLLPLPAAGAHPNVGSMELAPFVSTDPPVSDLLGLATRSVDCLSAETESTCRTRSALKATDSCADSPEIVGICAGIPVDRLRAECTFQAAERGSTGCPASWSPASVKLCLLSGTFAQRCLYHLAYAHGRAAGWEEKTARIEGATTVLSPWDPKLAARFRAVSWSLAADQATQHARPAMGDGLDHVPDDLAPVVRSAVAWRLWEDEGRQRRTALDWVRRMALLLRNRGGEPDWPAMSKGEVAVLWDRLLPGEEAIPVVPYLGNTWRGVGGDPDADSLIAILEVAARSSSPPEPLFREALFYPDPVVRWTAARLMRARTPNPAPIAVLATHSDALVLAYTTQQLTGVVSEVPLRQPDGSAGR